MTEYSKGIWSKKRALYGCIDCLKKERGECRDEDPCEFSGTFDQYESYSEYIQKSDPIILDAWEEKLKAGSQRWRSNSLILKDLTTGEKFRTISEAAEKLGCYVSNICEHLRGQHKTIRGHKFVWVSE